jgi:hypothetical protein
MRNKDLLRKGIYAFTTAAFVAAMGFAIDAEASTIYPCNVKVDSESQTLFVEPGGESGDDTEVLVGIGTGKVKDSKTVVAIKDSDWDVHDVSDGSVKVDLSSIKPAKDAYVEVKGNVNDDPIAIKITASNQKLKAEKPDYSTENPTVAFKNTVEKETYEYRTSANDGWNDFVSGTTDLTSYLDKGATLFVRSKATGGTADLDGYIDGELSQSKAGLVVHADAKSDVTTPLYDQFANKTIAFAGKEVKVSIAKRANAPKLAADYVKAKITLPKNTLARILKEETGYDVTGAKWEENSSDQKAQAEITVGKEKIKYGVDTDNILEAKTKNDPKKPASKIVSLKIPAVSDDYKMEAGKASTVSGGSIDNAMLKTKSGSSLVVTATVDSKFTLDKGGKINFKNDDKTNAFDIALVDDKTAPETLTKYTTIKAEKSGSLSVKNTDVGKFVYIRQAGDKKAATWPSKFVFLGTVGKNTVPSGAESGGGSGETASLSKVDFSGLTEGALTLSKDASDPKHTATITANPDVTDDATTYTWSLADGKDNGGDPEDGIVTLSATNTKSVTITGAVKGTITVKVSVTTNGVTKENSFKTTVTA